MKRTRKRVKSTKIIGLTYQLVLILLSFLYIFVLTVSIYVILIEDVLN